MKDFIGEYKNALSKNKCEQIILWMNSCNFNQGLISGKVDLKRKNSLDLHLNFNSFDVPINDDVLEVLTISMQKYKNKNLELDNIGRWQIDPRYNAQKYLPGMGYHMTHCESDGSDINRIMAWTIYLNTVNKGGETNFPFLRKKVKAEVGKCVIWPAGWTHMHHGIVAKEEIKYILTGWYKFI